MEKVKRKMSVCKVAQKVTLATLVLLEVNYFMLLAVGYEDLAMLTLVGCVVLLVADFVICTIWNSAEVRYKALKRNLAKKNRENVWRIFLSNTREN